MPSFLKSFSLLISRTNLLIPNQTDTEYFKTFRIYLKKCIKILREGNNDLINKENINLRKRVIGNYRDLANNYDKYKSNVNNMENSGPENLKKEEEISLGYVDDEDSSIDGGS